MKSAFRRAAEWSQRWPVFLLGLAWICYVVAGRLWPASWWMEVQPIRIPHAQAGAPVLMHVERLIHRDFTARWAVLVRLEKPGMSEVVCAADAVSDYRADAHLPAVVTLHWWTAGKCATLPPGHYSLTTIWQIHGLGLMPDKELQAVSNLFEVLP